MNHITPQNPRSLSPSFDPRALRDAFGCFATGVTVATALDPSGEPIGFTANSFISVSLDPPLILVCLGKWAAGYDAYVQATGFCVNILGSHQEDVSTRFATRGADKFKDTPWTFGASGAPVLTDNAGFLDCLTDRVIDAGDHALLIGRVVDLGTSDHSPLCFHKGRYARLAPTPSFNPAANQPQGGGS